MQYVEGENLAARMRRKPPEVRDALGFGLEAAQALVEAHRHGVIHRDIKPENVMVTASGRVKVLDFGLAQTTGPVAEAATTFERLTEEGAIAGTVRYMSPEQVKGEAVDERSDIFSLGAVIYEMLARAHPFGDASLAETIAAILTREPARLGDHIPLEVRRIVFKCLEKDRERRYQTARDLAIDLDSVARDLALPRAGVPTSLGQPARPGVGMRRARWVAALLVVGITGFMIGRALLDRPAPLPSPSEYVPITNFPDSAAAPAISRDGSMVAFLSGGELFLSRGQVWVKRLSGGDATRLTNDPRPKYGLAFSPDGSRVAYSVVDRGGWSTWAVPVNGGEATQLLPNAAGLTWIDNRHLLFSEIKTGLHMGVVSATTARAGKRTIYFPPHERAMAHYSAVSPDRRWLLVTEMNRAGGWDPCRIIPFAGAAAGRDVGPPGACRSAAWSPDGQWMYFAVHDGVATHLWRQRFPKGIPEPLTSGPATDEQGLAVAPDGSIITSVGRQSSSLWLHDANGARLLPSEGYAVQPRFSRDGRRVFALVRGIGAAGLVLCAIDLETMRMEAVLPDVYVTQYDLSPDETTIAFSARHGHGDSRVWVAPVDRSSAPRVLVEHADNVWFATNDDLVYRVMEGHANFLERIRRDGTDRTRVVDQAIIDVQAASPDGRWAVVQASGPKVTEATVVLAVPMGGGQPRLLCRGYCRTAWSRDGRFFFLSNVSPARTLAAPIPARQAFPPFPTDDAAGYDMWPALPGVQYLDADFVARGSDPMKYVSVKTDQMRNLFRIPIR
jgi:Tol biopolymer transport system component